MRKYIQPKIDISLNEVILLAGINLSNGEGNEGDFFTNQALYDDLEDAYPTKGNDLWDDTYQNDGI